MQRNPLVNLGAAEITIVLSVDLKIVWAWSGVTANDRDNVLTWKA